VKETFGQFVPVRLGVYFAAAMSAISQGWSLDVSSMRLVMWIVAGSEVRAPGYMQAHIRVLLGLHRERFSGD